MERRISLDATENIGERNKETADERFHTVMDIPIYQHYVLYSPV
jgi:hypothetical protein